MSSSVSCADSYELLVESGETGGAVRFTVEYHFENVVRSAGDRCQPSRMKRLAQEAATLMTSLPLSVSSSVFTRCDTDRLDIMKVIVRTSCRVFHGPLVFHDLFKASCPDSSKSSRNC